MSKSMESNLHEKQLRMETGKIIPLIFYFGLPGILSQLVQTSYSVVDTMFVGMATGDIGLAAVNITFPAILFFVALAILVAVGTETLFGMKLGEKRYDTCAHILGTTISCNAILSLIVAAIVIIFAEPILRLSGASDVLMEPAKTYLLIYGGFFISQNLGYTINGFISASGHPNRALATHIIAASLNILLDWLFVIHLGWGVAGAAWASVIAWSSGCVFAMHFFLSSQSPFKLKISHFKPQLSLFVQSLKFGLPMFLMQLGGSISFVIILRSVAYYGSLSWIGAEAAVAVYGIVGKGYQVLILAAVGLCIGCSPLLSYNLGAQKFDRLIKIFIYLCIISFTLTVALWIPVLIFSFKLVALFGLSEQYLEYASHLMKLDIMLAPIIALEIAAGMLFMASGKYIQGAVLQIMRSLIVICAFTISFPLILPKFFDLQAFTCIVVAEPATDTALFFLTIALLIPLMKKIQAVRKGEMTAQEAKLTPPVQ